MIKLYCLMVFICSFEWVFWLTILPIILFYMKKLLKQLVNIRWETNGNAVESGKTQVMEDVLFAVDISVKHGFQVTSKHVDWQNKGCGM